MEDSRNIIKAIDALTLKAGGEAVDSKNITEAIDHLKEVYSQEAIGIDGTLTQEGLAADAKVVGDAINGLSFVWTVNASDLSDLNTKFVNKINAMKDGEQQKTYLKMMNSSGTIFAQQSMYEGFIARNTSNYGVCFLMHHSGSNIMGFLNNGAVNWVAEPARFDTTELTNFYNNRVENAGETSASNSHISKKGKVCTASIYVRYLIEPGSDETTIYKINEDYIFPMRDEYSTVLNITQNKVYVFQATAGGDINILNNNSISLGDVLCGQITWISRR